MRILFTIDPGTYLDGLPTYERHAVRALICRDGLMLMQQGTRGDYKLPGGGMERGENQLEALRREVLEETGLTILPGSEQPFGQVTERRRDYRESDRNFIQQSFCYVCCAADSTAAPAMTAQELSWGLHPVWVTLDQAIATNRRLDHEDWALRDTRILECFRDMQKEDAP